MEKYHYDVALSFAEEDLNSAQSLYLALKLTQKENTIFFYKKSLYTSGKVLKNELPELYKHQAKFVVMLVSKDYVNKEKVFAPIEAEAIIQRWKFNPSESFLIPIIIDDTPLNKVDPSLSNDIARVKWDQDPEQLAEKIWELVRFDEHRNRSKNTVPEPSEKGKTINRITINDNSSNKSGNGIIQNGNNNIVNTNNS